MGEETIRISVWVAGNRWHWLRFESGEIVASGSEETEREARQAAQSYVKAYKPAEVKG